MIINKFHFNIICPFNFIYLTQFNSFIESNTSSTVFPSGRYDKYIYCSTFLSSGSNECDSILAARPNTWSTPYIIPEGFHNMNLSNCF